MASYRDQIRAKQAETAAEVRKQGINVDDIRRESRGLQATGAMLARLANESTPTAGHERIYGVDFLGQVFNGTNQDFTLPISVLGQNILVWHIQQSTGTVVPLAKTTNPAPSGGQFFFDGYITVRVGTPPQAADGLLCAIITPL